MAFSLSAAERHFQIHYGLHLGCGWRLSGLRMTQSRVRRLLRKILQQGMAGSALAAVPHHGSEKAQSRGGQGPAIEREISGRGAVKWVINPNEREFGAIGHTDADADKAFAEQLAVGLAAGGDGRNIGTRTVGAIIRTEDGIEAAGLGEALANVRGANAHGVGRLVAS